MWIPVWKLAEANLTNLSRSEKHIDFVKAPPRAGPAPAPAATGPRRVGGGRGPAGASMRETSMPCMSPRVGRVMAADYRGPGGEFAADACERSDETMRVPPSQHAPCRG